MKTAATIILLIYIALQLFKYLLEYINVRHVRARGDRVPLEFEGAVEPALLGRMRVYLEEKTLFEVISSACASCVIIAFLFTGLLDAYNSWIVSLGLPFVLSGWLFFLLLYLAGELASAPFALYSVFRIENRHGFNTMTFGLWVADFLKGTLLSTVLLSLAVLGGLWLVQWSPSVWWFWIWCFFLVFSLFVTYISPYVIEPLFNKFTPMEEGTLRERIINLASRAGIGVSKVLRMDASKRSTHTNAYFAGFGRAKRIILFDTLLARMSEDETISVLAHEIGHWKRHHLLKGLLLSQLLSLAVLFCAYRLMDGPLLSSVFGIVLDTFPAKALMVAFLFGMVLFFLKAPLNGFSRILEKEADRVSCDLTPTGDTMITVLVKLSKDNLSNLFPHALYALFNYSHPPVLERIAYIKAYCARKEARGT
jgi:STE24 endopeptidase